MFLRRKKIQDFMKKRDCERLTDFLNMIGYSTTAIINKRTLFRINNTEYPKILRIPHPNLKIFGMEIVFDKNISELTVGSERRGLKACKQCGRCCENLYWYDRLILSWHFKTLQLSKVCKFLYINPGWHRNNPQNYKCLKQKDKPDLCKNWKCGAF